MDLRKTILAEHSKAQANKIIEWVGDSQQRFDELFNLFLNDEYRVQQRAAWPLSYIAIAHPHLIKKHFRKLLSNLKKSNHHSSIKRNSVRLLQHIEIPAIYHGEIMNLCFNYVSSPNEAVAVKAFSLIVLQNLAKKYPEILPEIKLIIEERWNYETAAFRSRAKKIFYL